MASPALRDIKVDASAEGCSGMYWRTEMKMSATSSRSDWPRNGAVHKGSWESAADGSRWARFDNGMYLPEKQAGFTILFDVTK